MRDEKDYRWAMDEEAYRLWREAVNAMQRFAMYLDRNPGFAEVHDLDRDGFLALWKQTAESMYAGDCCANRDCPSRRNYSDLTAFAHPPVARVRSESDQGYRYFYICATCGSMWTCYWADPDLVGEALP